MCTTTHTLSMSRRGALVSTCNSRISMQSTAQHIHTVEQTFGIQLVFFEVMYTSHPNLIHATEQHSKVGIEK